MKRSKRHAPGFANRRLATGHRNVVEMREPVEVAWIGTVEPHNQHFPAPDAAIGAIARSIERKANDRTHERMLRHACSNMRVMMLHSDQTRIALGSPFFGPRRRQVAGMQIVNHNLRFDLECVHHMGKRLAKEFETSQILEVAEVLALVNKATARQREYALEVPADGKYRRRIKWQRYGQRHKTTGTADQLWRSINQRHHRVVATLQNLAVM